MACGSAGLFGRFRLRLAFGRGTLRPCHGGAGRALQRCAMGNAQPVDGQLKRHPVVWPGRRRNRHWHSGVRTCRPTTPTSAPSFRTPAVFGTLRCRQSSPSLQREVLRVFAPGLAGRVHRAISPPAAQFREPLDRPIERISCHAQLSAARSARFPVQPAPSAAQPANPATG